jgi:AcrR family transcriptional regulator
MTAVPPSNPRPEPSALLADPVVLPPEPLEPLAPGCDLSAPTVPRMRADARRNREKIVEAARAVFATQGASAQMDDVAAAAGVGVGTVYRHFSTKDAIIGELLRQKFEVIASSMEAARETEDDPGEALLLGMRRSAEAIADDVAAQHVLAGAHRPEAWVIAAPAQRRLNAISSELIEGGQASGTLRADLQVSDLRIVMGGVSATMADQPIAHLWRRHLDLVIGSLRALPSGHA